MYFSHVTSVLLFQRISFIRNAWNQYKRIFYVKGFDNFIHFNLYSVHLEESYWKWKKTKFLMLTTFSKYLKWALSLKKIRKKLSLVSLMLQAAWVHIGHPWSSSGTKKLHLNLTSWSLSVSRPKFRHQHSLMKNYKSMEVVWPTCWQLFKN